MGLEVNVAGVWKPVASIEVNVGGVWKTVSAVEVNVAGVWKPTYREAPEVVALADGDTNQNFGVQCYAGPHWDSDGFEHELTPDGTKGSVIQTWLRAGVAEDVWVEFTRTGGTESAFHNRSNSTRYNITSDIAFYILDSSAAGAAITITGYFKFYDAATGGNTLETTTEATWSARMNDPL